MTTPSTPTGEALIARLEAAEVGYRSLDFEIEEAIGGEDIWPPFYTTSLDAALALAERVAGPDQALAILVTVSRQVFSNAIDGNLNRLPMLVCAALLRATGAAQ